MELTTYAAPAAGDQHVRMRTTQAQVYATLPVVCLEHQTQNTRRSVVDHRGNPLPLMVSHFL